jgi:hypothetical protein
VLRGKYNPVKGLKDVEKGTYLCNHLDRVILNTVAAILHAAVTLLLTPAVLRVARALLLSLQQPLPLIVRSEPEPLSYLLVIRILGSSASIVGLLT